MKKWKLIPSFMLISATSSLVVQAASLEAEVQPEGTLLQSAQPASLEQGNFLVKTPLEEADIARQITSRCGVEALKILCGTENGVLKRFPTPDEMALANHFDNYWQIKALKELGASYAEVAHQITSEYGGLVLKLFCGYEEGVFQRLPTPEDIALANRFDDYWKIKALKELGASYAEVALQLTSLYGVDALKLFCEYEEGVFQRPPTSENIALANCFKNSASIAVLSRFGASYVEEALQITSRYGEDVLKILCGTQNGVLKRLPTPDEIALANHFDDDSQIKVLKELGASYAEVAHQITSRYGGAALKVLCGYENGVLKRLPTPEDIALANRFSVLTNFHALEDLGAPYAEIALQITSRYGGKVLKLFWGYDESVLKRFTDEDIALANEVDSAQVVEALRLIKSLSTFFSFGT